MIEISRETLRRIQILFPMQQHRKVETYLRDECGDNLPLINSDNTKLVQRIRFAVLKISNGKIEVLKKQVAQAAIDWRDVLMAAGFGEDTKAHLAWQPEKII